MSLKDYAERLADEMNVAGHEVSTLDILDSLACAGLTLIEGTVEGMNEASLVHLETLQQWVKGET